MLNPNAPENKSADPPPWPQSPVEISRPTSPPPIPSPEDLADQPDDFITLAYAIAVFGPSRVQKIWACGQHHTDPDSGEPVWVRSTIVDIDGALDIERDGGVNNDDHP